MKATFICLLFISISTFIFAQEKTRTRIYVIGNIHDSVPNYTPQLLLEIIQKIKPDVILHEVDSAMMQDYIANNNIRGNEIQASNLFVEKYPQTIRLPFDFEGRNQYRKEKGMVPTDNLTVKLIDSLYKAKALNVEHSALYKRFTDLNQKLTEIALLSPENFNNTTTDAICKERQESQYKDLLKIVNERPEFLSNTIIKPNGENITYREGFTLMCQFWDTRNRVMAKHIHDVAKKYQGKRIVVLTGFLHRYYLISELKRLCQNDYSIKEYYQY